MNESKALGPPMSGRFCGGVATLRGSLISGLVVAAPNGNPVGGPPSGSQAPEFPVKYAVQFRLGESAGAGAKPDNAQ
eukprot:1447433-Lingulodinium_polyedra.AAC.1